MKKSKMEYTENYNRIRKEVLEILLNELNDTRKQSAYGNNFLLDTIIKRVKELILNKVDTDTRIGF